MREKFKYLLLPVFIFFIIVCTTTTIANPSIASSLDTDSSGFIKKVSKAYTKKFCNSVAFGLSKESAMNFSIKENKEVFKNKKEMKNINTELLAEEIAVSVIEECGYPINLFGEKGIEEFKIYYLSKDKEL